MTNSEIALSILASANICFGPGETADRAACTDVPNSAFMVVSFSREDREGEYCEYCPEGRTGIIAIALIEDRPSVWEWKIISAFIAEENRPEFVGQVIPENLVTLFLLGEII